MKKLQLAIPLAALIALAGCGGETASQAPAPGAAPAGETVATIPAELVSPAPIADALPVLEAKKNAVAGQEIAFTGVVAGRAQPFTSGRAVMLVSDASLPFCDDHCNTPWDACCETQEDVRRLTATVQVLDADGTVLRTGLEGHGGLAPGGPVQVRGIVQESGDNGLLIVNATQLHIPRE